MIPERTKPWQANGTRASSRASRPGSFIDQHVSPLLYHRTDGGLKVRDCMEILSEEQFWGHGDKVVFGAVRLIDFRISDWFPRAPGVFWSRRARNAREMVSCEQPQTDADLGRYFSPESKMDLIEDGGIGTIRLRPRKIDGEDCWLATALSGTACHCGVPLAIPRKLFREAGVSWGDRVALKGSVRFHQDNGLHETPARVHHARPLIVFVDDLRGVVTKQSVEPIAITPVALFERSNANEHFEYDSAKYTFVHCAAGPDSELDKAVEWIEKYAAKHDGRVITNFDEQRPILADAPLSYQRLVTKTYDRTIIERFRGTINVDRIDRVVQESLTIGDVPLGHTDELIRKPCHGTCGEASQTRTV